MEQISRCQEEDIPALVKLHLKIYGVQDKGSINSLELHFRRILFDNPWRDEENPPLVLRSKKGDIEAFMGVIVRRMVYKGKPIRVVAAHSLMVDPDCGSPMAVINLMKKVLSGPQDLLISESSNARSTPFWTAMGAGVSYLHSTYWLCLFRPLKHFGAILSRKQGLIRLLGWGLQSVAVFGDPLISIFWRHYFRFRQSESGRIREVDCRALLLSMNKYFHSTPLHPEYSESDLQCMADIFEGKTYGGMPHGFEVLNEKGQRVGSCVCCLDRSKGLKVLFLWAREDATNFVFNKLLKYAMKLGAKSVGGRVEPRFLKSISDSPCRIRQRNSWFVVHSKNLEILDAIYQGDAVLSEFDNEEFIVTYDL